MSRKEHIRDRMKHVRRFFRRGDVRLGDMVGENSISDFLHLTNPSELKWASERVRRARIEEEHEPGERSRSIQFFAGRQNGVSVSVEFENEYEHGVLEREMKVKLRGGAAGEAYSVVVDGNQLGTITTNQQGMGVLRLSTAPDRGEQVWTWAEARAVTLNSTLRIGDNVFSSTIGHETAFRDLSRSASIAPVESEIEMRAAGGLRGWAEWEVEPEHGGVERKFTVKVRNADPGDSLAVSVDGVKVGAVLVDGRGRGRLELTNRPDDSGESPLPDHFPGVSQGTRVQIGDDLSGMFGASAGSNSGEPSEIELKAPLMMNGSRGFGRASFEQEVEHGQLELKLNVAVRNLKPNQDLLVSLAGESLGVLHTNGRGNGRLELTNMPDHFREMALPENFSGVSAGTSITIGKSVSGVFGFSPS